MRNRSSSGMDALVIRLGRNGHNYGSGMDALVIGPNPKTNPTLKAQPQTLNPEIADARKPSTLNPKTLNLDQTQTLGHQPKTPNLKP